MSATPAGSSAPIGWSRSMTISTCRPLWREQDASGGRRVAAIAGELRRIGRAPGRAVRECDRPARRPSTRRPVTSRHGCRRRAARPRRGTRAAQAITLAPRTGIVAACRARRRRLRDRVGAVERVVEAAPARIGGVERVAGVASPARRAAARRSRRSRDRRSRCRSAKSRAFGDQIADLAQEGLVGGRSSDGRAVRGARRRSAPATRRVGRAARGSSARGRAASSASPLQKRVGLDAGAGQRLRLDELRQFGCDLETVPVDATAHSSTPSE